MRRREFVKLVGGATAVLPLVAHAQQLAMPEIGFLGSDSADLYAERLSAFRSGLKQVGYAEGQNVAVEYRWAKGHNDRLPELAADLVRRRVAVLIGSTTPTALALKAATTQIPIVFFVAGDPVALGLVASLSRPGGNLTGTTSMTLEVGSKWLQLLHEIIPAESDFAVLVNPTSSVLAKSQTNDLQAAARTLGLRLHLLQASTDSDLDTVFADLGQPKPAGLVITSDSFFFTRAERLAALATRFRLPATFGFPEFAKAGGLISYGASVTEQHRTIGVYAGRILKGEKPADLPIQQSTKVELIINLRTAKALGVTVPNTLIGRADEVIE
jgi:putative tryptophan/tyrosine transport system substrate-binding protein